jgi:hypothetical protein
MISYLTVVIAWEPSKFWDHFISIVFPCNILLPMISYLRVIADQKQNTEYAKIQWWTSLDVLHCCTWGLTCRWIIDFLFLFFRRSKIQIWKHHCSSGATRSGVSTTLGARRSCQRADTEPPREGDVDEAVLPARRRRSKLSQSGRREGDIASWARAAGEKTGGAPSQEVVRVAGKTALCWVGARCGCLRATGWGPAAGFWEGTAAGDASKSFRATCGN